MPLGSYRGAVVEQESWILLSDWYKVEAVFSRYDVEVGICINSGGNSVWRTWWLLILNFIE